MSSNRKRESKTTEIRVAGVNEKQSCVVGSFFNGLQIPSSTEFDLYQHKKRTGDFILHGENDKLIYEGEDQNGSASSNNDYIVAVYDPINKSVDLFKSPYVNGKVISRAKRTYKGPAVKQVGTRNVDQRNALGEAFGTKKAKSAIANVEKNRIDADKLQDVESDIIDSLAKTTQALPTRQEIDTGITQDRPTPVANVDATNVEDIYPIHNIIPKREWSFLRVGPILEASGDDSVKLELLPYGKSNYVQQHLNKIISTGSTEKLQLLYYASLLFGVYEHRRVKDKESLLTRLENKPSEILIDGVLERFTIARTTQYGKSKDRSFIIDPNHEDKLLCYLLAIIFHLDNFMVELSPLANELNMKPTRLVSLMKALGAVVKSSTVAQAEAFGIPKAAASTYKVATLKVPFKLPEMSRRVRKSGR
ncbi:DNA-directed RNA polymerase I subunit Rpa49p [[Candida] railenensis]|uniref:DNA-directed RNA polymerase I subunit Rpa49p n=1 Tax=[Candida] railenensis TaxID=45579 RepID=A0A9P0QLA4_9ASCO|nr:DNA-directed RNA polymerase I subunit Rpa49p [[Candida] railenensis]